jgi:hypothetical protein
MSVSFSSRVTVPSDVMLNTVDGESVILSLNTESYFGLDYVGTRMWTTLTTSDSIQRAYEALLSEYEVDPADLRRDLNNLIEKLVQNGLVEVCET